MKVLNKNIKVEIIKSQSELEEVYKLTYKSYYQAGLIQENKNRKVIHHPELDSMNSTFIIAAKIENRIIGTLTLSIDDRNGLPVDGSFKNETDKIRNEGLKLASCWRIAIDPEYNVSVAVLMKIIQKMVDLIYINDVETVLFSFSPRHAKIYSRMINLIPIAEGKDDNEQIREEESKVIMMRGSYESLPMKWKRAV